MYQKRISLLFILAFSLLFLISCGGAPGTNIKSGKVLTGYYTSDNAYYPMEYKRSDIVATNDNYTISFRLPETEPYTHIYEKTQALWTGRRLYRDTNGNMKDIVNISYYKQLIDTVKSTTSRLLMKNYRNKLRIIEEEPLIYIERTDIKTEKLKNPKYYLSIGVYGWEVGTGVKTYKTYQYHKELYTNYDTWIPGKTNVYIYYRDVERQADDYLIDEENLNIAFITMMRDGPKDELKPIHVENYWFFNDFAKDNTDEFIYQIKFQLYKFVDEVDYGYRGKLPPKPIDNEDDEY